MKQKVNSGPTQTGFSNMRSNSWCVATLTTGHCHWTRTGGSRLTCVCTQVCVRGTLDGVMFVSHRCSQWWPYNYHSQIPPCLVFPLHSRSSCSLPGTFFSPAFRLCLADVHVNIGRWLHSTCLVCSAAIHTVISISIICHKALLQLWNWKSYSWCKAHPKGMNRLIEAIGMKISAKSLHTKSIFVPVQMPLYV